MKKKEWLFPAITGGLLFFGGRRRVNRAMSSFTVLFTVVLVVALGSYLFITSIFHEIQNVQVSLPDYATRLYCYIPLEVKTYLEIETPDKACLQLNHLLDQEIGVYVVRETFDIFGKAVSSTLFFVLSILGMLLAVPATALLKVFSSSCLSWYRSRAYLTGA
jgi:predicted PurR-regulated permease PerM